MQPGCSTRPEAFRVHYNASTLSNLIGTGSVVRLLYLYLCLCLLFCICVCFRVFLQVCTLKSGSVTRSCRRPQRVNALCNQLTVRSMWLWIGGSHQYASMDNVMSWLGRHIAHLRLSSVKCNITRCQDPNCPSCICFNICQWTRCLQGQLPLLIFRKIWRRWY